MPTNQSERFKYHCNPPDRLTIVIGEVFDDNTAAELTKNTMEALASQPNTKHVVVDVRPLRDSSTIVRASLMKVQELLCQKNLRTAWLVATPRSRGLAMLVITLAQDSNARVCLTIEQANAWFASEITRLQQQLNNIGRQS